MVLNWKRMCMRVWQLLSLEEENGLGVKFYSIYDQEAVVLFFGVFHYGEGHGVNPNL